jgi:transcriptional regulator GlxA family with amidase domain
MISSATDFIIAIDSWRSQGSNIPSIVGWTSTIMALLFIPFITWQKFRAQPSRGDKGTLSQQGDDAAERELMGRIDSLVQRSPVHLDPDLNLNRMARKLGVPARQISVAINRQREVSVSQFINGLRIDEACRLLKETELPVTQVMLQSGFVTKSNFNREFSRQMGQSPSVWRSSNR